MVFLFYLLAVIALATGTAAIYMALIKPFPVQWLYYHYFIRKPLVWTILAGTVWNIRGKHIKGEIRADLVPIALSDEYWFSWKKFHPDSKLIRPPEPCIASS